MHDTLIVLHKIREALASYAKESESEKAKELVELIQQYDNFLLRLEKNPELAYDKVIVSASVGAVIKYVLEGVFENWFK